VFDFVLCIQFPLGIALALASPRGPSAGRHWHASLPSRTVDHKPCPMLSLMNAITGIWGSGWRDIGCLRVKDSVVRTWVVILAMEHRHWTTLLIILLFPRLTTIPDRCIRPRHHGARPWQCSHISNAALQHVIAHGGCCV